MKISLQVKEVKIVVLDDHNEVAFEYEVDNLKLSLAPQQIGNAIAALAAHFQDLTKTTN